MKVLCTNGVKAVTAELIPAIERTIGLTVDVDYASTNMLMDKIVGTKSEITGFENLPETSFILAPKHQ